MEEGNKSKTVGATERLYIKSQKGITLIALVITIILMVILAGVGYVYGKDAIDSAKLTKFTTELKIMQTEVNELYQEYKNANYSVLFLGEDLQDTEQESIAFKGAGVTDNTGFRYYSEATIKELGIEGVSQDCLVNVAKRTVISLNGISTDGKEYYTISQVSDGLYNVGYANQEDTDLIAVAPKIEITTTATEYGQYPEVLNIKAKSEAIGIKEVKVDGTTVYSGRGSNAVLTKTVGYNATKNGPITVTVTDYAGNTTTETYTVSNVVEFITEWTVEAGTTVTLPIYQSTPDIYVDWGDGKTQNITTLTEADRQHTYENAGSYDIKISGRLPQWGFNSVTNASTTSTNRNYVTAIKQWGVLQSTSMQYAFWECRNIVGSIPAPHKKSFENVTSFTFAFNYCSGLTGNIPSDLFANCPEVTSFEYTFYHCSGLAGSIPSGLFANCSEVTSFASTFCGCSGLTGNIPSDIFANCPEVTNFYYTFGACKGLTGNIPSGLFANCKEATNFTGTFTNCSGLTGSIPSELFENCKEVMSFGTTFFYCSGLTGNIPSDLFANCKEVTSFASTFYSCIGLTGSIPSGFFANCKEATDFHGTFMYCRGLTGKIPSDLFANCKEAINFDYTFYYCYGLTEVSSELFKNNAKVTNFSQTFYNCKSLNGSILFNQTGITSYEKCFTNCAIDSSCTGLTIYYTADNVDTVTAMYNTKSSSSNITLAEWE